MSEKINPQLEGIEVEAIEVPELNDFNELVEDFMDRCGYSEEEAQIAAKNVLEQDQL